MSSATHMRQTCRVMRSAPRTPGRSIRRRSRAAASAAILPNTKYAASGGSLGEVLGLFAAIGPNVKQATKTFKATRNAPISNGPMPPSLRLMVIQEVATK